MPVPGLWSSIFSQRHSYTLYNTPSSLSTHFSGKILLFQGIFEAFGIFHKISYSPSSFCQESLALKKEIPSPESLKTAGLIQGDSWMVIACHHQFQMGKMGRFRHFFYGAYGLTSQSLSLTGFFNPQHINEQSLFLFYQDGKTDPFAVFYQPEKPASLCLFVFNVCLIISCRTGKIKKQL